MKPILIYDSPITSLTEDGDYAREVADYICNLDSKYDIFFIDTPTTVVNVLLYLKTKT